ncbi:hypothetical protein E8E11_001432 [Didymella keratinophila]|nr:hypothetical protein E8E11_001432 [Didymella keratinophila]
MIRHDYSRIGPKRRANLSHKKKQFAKAEFQEQTYEHRLNFYILPPTAEITLEEFEQWAIDRLKVLSELEACTFRNKGPEETAEYMKSILDKYLPMRAGTSNGANLQEERKKDHYSHFILRLAFSATEDLRRRFSRLETMLFQLRFKDDDYVERREFVRTLNLEWEEVQEAEKRELKAQLLAAAGGGLKNAEEQEWFKVDWERVPVLVEQRRVFLKRGKAYVPQREQMSLVVAEFTKKLDEALELTSRALPRLDEDDRLAPILAHLSQNFTAPDAAYSSSDANIDGLNTITANSIDTLSQNFPLCMRNLHMTLRENSHLKHFGRLQYTLFLKGIGLSLDECIMFWRRSFKLMTDDKFQKEYRYNIRHAYGDVGGDSNRRGRGYTPYSCQKLLTEPLPGPGQTHGCPYRTFTPDNLISVLQRVGVNERDVLKTVREDVGKQRYHVACNRVFEWSHKREIKKVKDDGSWSATDLDTIVHPNTYFKRSWLLKHLGEGNAGIISGTPGDKMEEGPKHHGRVLAHEQFRKSRVALENFLVSIEAPNNATCDVAQAGFADRIEPGSLERAREPEDVLDLGDDQGSLDGTSPPGEHVTSSAPSPTTKRKLAQTSCISTAERKRIRFGKDVEERPEYRGTLEYYRGAKEYVPGRYAVTEGSEYEDTSGSTISFAKFTGQKKQAVVSPNPQDEDDSIYFEASDGTGGGVPDLQQNDPSNVDEVVPKWSENLSGALDLEQIENEKSANASLPTHFIWSSEERADPAQAERPTTVRSRSGNRSSHSPVATQSHTSHSSNSISRRRSGRASSTAPPVDRSPEDELNKALAGPSTTESRKPRVALSRRSPALSLPAVPDPKEWKQLEAFTGGSNERIPDEPSTLELDGNKNTGEDPPGEAEVVQAGYPGTRTTGIDASQHSSHTASQDPVMLLEATLDASLVQPLQSKAQSEVVESMDQSFGELINSRDDKQDTHTKSDSETHVNNPDLDLAVVGEAGQESEVDITDTDRHRAGEEAQVNPQTIPESAEVTKPETRSADRSFQNTIDTSNAELQDAVGSSTSLENATGDHDDANIKLAVQLPRDQRSAASKLGQKSSFDLIGVESSELDNANRIHGRSGVKEVSSQQHRRKSSLRVSKEVSYVYEGRDAGFEKNIAKDETRPAGAASAVPQVNKEHAFAARDPSDIAQQASNHTSPYPSNGLHSDSTLHTDEATE